MKADNNKKPANTTISSVANSNHNVFQRLHVLGTRGRSSKTMNRPITPYSRKTISTISEEKIRQQTRIDHLRKARRKYSIPVTRKKNNQKHPVSNDSISKKNGNDMTANSSHTIDTSPASSSPGDENKTNTTSSSVDDIRDINKPIMTDDDTVARMLDVPVANFIRKAEDEALKAGHENKGFLSFRNGFLPMIYPEQKLPPQFHAWDFLGKNLNTMMSNLSLRPFVDKKLPLLSASKDNLQDRYLFRAVLILGLSSHAYWYCGPTEPEQLPDTLKTPWDQICSRLGRKGSYLSGEDVQLYNFSYNNLDFVKSEGGTFDCQDPEFKIENLSMLHSMWGNQAEIVFHLAFCEMAKAAAPLLRLFCHAQDAVQRCDDELICSTLHSIADAVENIQVAFMKIIPDPNARLGMEPLVWAKTVAPVGVSFNKGMPSPSGLGTPFFHCLDTFFGRGQYASVLGRDSIGARKFFPSNWSGVLCALSEVSIHAYVVSSRNEELHTAWSHAIDVYASWNGMLGKHLQKTYGFLELAFKTGRQKTLGGFEGGFADRMWDRVMDMLDRSREERLVAKNDTLAMQGSKVITSTVESNNVSANTQILEYKLPHQGFYWKPGDTVSLWPSNSNQVVLDILRLMEATGDEMVDLSDEWWIYLKKFVDLGKKEVGQSPRAKLKDLLRFAKLTPAPDKTLKYLASFFPDMINLRSPDLNVHSIMGRARVLYGDELFNITDDGTLAGLTMVGEEEMYRHFVSFGTEPLVEVVITTLRAIGIRDIPIFNSRFVNYECFEEKVYPLFVDILKSHESTCGRVTDLFYPLEPRQYSIANIRKEPEELCMKLIVNRLSYKKNQHKEFQINTDWKTSERSAVLAKKYFKIWYMKVHGLNKSTHSSNKLAVSAHSLHVDEFISSLDSDYNKVHKGVASSYLCSGGNLIFNITSNPAFRPPPTSEPLFMAAAGSGVSPFLAYIEERVAAKTSAPTILMWSISFLKDCEHVLTQLENMLNSAKTDVEIIVIVSRENNWPIFRDGKFHIESRPKGRITDFLERNIELRKKLQLLLLPQKYNGSGGFAYLCGSASFVQSTLDVVSGVLTDVDLFGNRVYSERFTSDRHGKLSSKWLLQELQSNQRILYEVFNDKTSENPPLIHISDLVTMNDFCINGSSESLWIAINGEIYNVKNFVHPGGSTILHSYCGMDATKAWESVRHHKSQSLNAKLATLHIGRLKVPRFTPLPLLKLDNNTSTDINGVFNAWRALLFDVVEIQNAVKLEYSVEVMHIAGHSPKRELTPMKLQMILQAHRRFVFSHIRNVTRGLVDALRYAEALRHPQDLVSSEVKIVGVSTNSISSFDQLRAKLAASDHTKKTLEACDLFIASCHEIHDVSNEGTKSKNEDMHTMVEYLTNSCRILTIRDIELLTKWKDSLRSVVKYFETRDMQLISLSQLYHELESASLSMMKYLKSYTAQVSSPAVLRKLWKCKSDDTSIVYNGDDWLLSINFAKAGIKETTWQAKSLRKEDSS